MSDIVLELKNIERRYEQPESKLEVLNGLSLTVTSGEAVALVGQSGSGKSTLLHIAGLLERPSGGDVLVTDKLCGEMNDRERTILRRHQIGFVYQYHHLMPEFSALENVTLPQMMTGKSKSTAKEKAAALLDAVGLSERYEHRPAKLSGGEQQRVAVARALANDPEILLADEPTGNLDSDTAEQVFELLQNLIAENSLAALIATHNPDLASRLDRCLMLEQGQVREQSV
ncbi:MAG: ABC transporter [Rhodospirillaceae bacterium]|nr:ABC transporter [Rhodospirillaceae bacterium]|tara:strand:- start:317 stop:1003 length:687 start_codon:yes stop_codon:yes gene_type:complete